MSLSDKIHHKEKTLGQWLHKQDVKEAVKRIRERGLDFSRKNDDIDRYIVGIKAGICMMLNIIKEELGKELCSGEQETK